MEKNGDGAITIVRRHQSRLLDLLGRPAGFVDEHGLDLDSCNSFGGVGSRDRAGVDTLTIASFFSVAMAATLVGALVTSQVRRPEAAVADTAQSQARLGAGSMLGLETFRDIARATNAGVVNINTAKTVRLPRNRDPFRDFFGQGDDSDRLSSPAPEGERSDRRTRTSLGSGFVIDDQGYILTNRHVIEGADEINVTFPDGKRYEAKIVGQDARTDVALIKIERR